MKAWIIQSIRNIQFEEDETRKKKKKLNKIKQHWWQKKISSALPKILPQPMDVQTAWGQRFSSFTLSSIDVSPYHKQFDPERQSEIQKNKKQTKNLNCPQRNIVQKHRNNTTSHFSFIRQRSQFRRKKDERKNQRESNIPNVQIQMKYIKWCSIFLTDIL